VLFLRVVLEAGEDDDAVCRGVAQLGVRVLDIAKDAAVTLDQVVDMDDVRPIGSVCRAGDPGMEVKLSGPAGILAEDVVRVLILCEKDDAGQDRNYAGEDALHFLGLN